MRRRQLGELGAAGVDGLAVDSVGRAVLLVHADLMRRREAEGRRRDAGRCSEMQGDVGGDVARYTEMYADVGEELTERRRQGASYTSP